MAQKNPKDKKDLSWLWIPAIILVNYLITQATGCNPLMAIGSFGSGDGGAAEYYADKAYYAEVDNIPCSHVFSDGHGTVDAYKGCIRKLTQTASSIDNSVLSNQNLGGCPSGCDYHKASCDIKGNIGFVSKEKIYHLPGMEFYDQTVIDPFLGERWFCTEAEAVANGWRKSRSD